MIGWNSQPDTGCDLCWLEEAPVWWRLRARLGARRGNPFAGLAAVSRAMLGAPAVTWYERHRRDWEATGDTKHLTRMLRHADEV